MLEEVVQASKLDQLEVGILASFECCTDRLEIILAGDLKVEGTVDCQHRTSDLFDGGRWIVTDKPVDPGQFQLTDDPGNLCIAIFAI